VTTVARDVASYERWLRKQCDVAELDLKTKHERMRKSPFDFLRATYFRWATTIEATCPELVDAPQSLCVGDIHVENFGTWRDARARLVWGVNDFDEAAPMPYAYDLVRLLASARLAPTLAVNRREAAVALLEGYQKGLEQPRPVLLDEHEHWLRRLVGGAANASQKFWKEVDGYPDAKPPVPVRRALKRSLPSGARIERYASRVKGSGSLGRPRYLVIALWQGGRIVQEAKALVPSAWHWAHPDSSAKSRILDLAFGPHRSPDPHLRVKAGYVLRRIAADAHKVELADVSGQGLSEALLAAMGAELGAIHAVRHRTAILKDLRKRDARWLDRAAAAAEKSVRRDFTDFKRQVR
jgi:hypothetical protein